MFRNKKRNQSRRRSSTLAWLLSRRGRCQSCCQPALPSGRKQRTSGVDAIAAIREKAPRALVPVGRVIIKELPYKKSSLILGIHVCVKKFASAEGERLKSRAESHLCWRDFSALQLALHILHQLLRLVVRWQGFCQPEAAGSEQQGTAQQRWLGRQARPAGCCPESSGQPGAER